MPKRKKCAWVCVWQMKGILVKISSKEYPLDTCFSVHAKIMTSQGAKASRFFLCTTCLSQTNVKEGNFDYVSRILNRCQRCLASCSKWHHANFSWNFSFQKMLCPNESFQEGMLFNRKLVQTGPMCVEFPKVGEKDLHTCGFLIS